MKLKFKLISFFTIILLCALGMFASAQVYVRIELQPDTWHYYDSSYDESEVYDMYIRAYTDASCTTPATLSTAITIGFQTNYTYQDSYNSYSGSNSTPISIDASESEFYYDDKPLSLTIYSPFSKYTFSYSLQSGTGYIVVPGYTFVP